MAANNDNQGLKIAVACFVMLSVVLAVTTYFGFKNYAETDAKLVTAQGEVKSEKDEQAKLQRIVNDLKDTIGVTKTEDAEASKAIKKNIDEITKKVATAADETRKAIDQYKGAGGALGNIDALKQSLDTITSGMNDPAKTLQSTADRLQELLLNQSMIATHLGLEFHDTRKQLEAANQVNQAKLDVETKAVKDTKTDLEAEHNKHETDRISLGNKVDALQTDTNKQAQEIIRLKNQLTAMEDDFKKRTDDLLVQLRNWRDIAEKKDTVLDKKDGVVQFVDYGRGEVRTSIGRSVGAHEQMVLSVFDKNAPGLPTDKPKGTVELIQVGPNGSLARIIDTKNSINPIRSGDQLYSPTWDPGRPQQFALIGKMDVNRDGRDDREDLKRMIQASGGIVSYDLPPPGVGVESGKLTPLIAWYVVDDRDAFHPAALREGKGMGTEEQGFLDKRTTAIKTARLDGIRPLSIERLLSQLGYSYNSPIIGRAEAANRPAINDILHPKGRVATPPPAGDMPATPPAAEEKPATEKPDAEKPETEKPEGDAEKPK
ncbi:MAG: hypothetical protein JWN86_2950 [Planctomycetota bacterium]|nr:hypothetical protein [Planctomycetota bacterium]